MLGTVVGWCGGHPCCSPVFLTLLPFWHMRALGSSTSLSLDVVMWLALANVQKRSAPIVGGTEELCRTLCFLFLFQLSQESAYFILVGASDRHPWKTGFQDLRLRMSKKSSLWCYSLRLEGFLYCSVIRTIWLQSIILLVIVDNIIGYSR